MWEVLFPFWEWSTLLVSSSTDHSDVLYDGNSVSNYGSSSTGISLVHLIEMRVETIFLGHRNFFFYWKHCFICYFINMMLKCILLQNKIFKRRWWGCFDIEWHGRFAKILVNLGCLNRNILIWFLSHMPSLVLLIKKWYSCEMCEQR